MYFAYFSRVGHKCGMVRYSYLYFFCVYNSGITKVCSNRKMTDGEKALLLLHDLGHCDCTHVFLPLVNDLKFPKQIKSSLSYRLLEFSREDKVLEFERLTTTLPFENLIQSSYTLLKEHVWIPHFQKDIEKLAMEKIYWSSCVKKKAGSILCRVIYTS